MAQIPGWHPAPDNPGQLRYWDGTRWTDHYSAAPQAPATPATQSRAGLWIALGLVGVLTVGCIAIAASGDETATDDDPPSATRDDNEEDEAPDPNEVIGDEIGARVVCQQFVEDRLKAPSTAEFSDESEEHVNGPVWLATGSVDAENGFGAMIRSEYACRVRFTGDDQWRLLSLTGLD